MPTYKITDPNTKKVIRLTAERPPTQTEVAEIFGGKQPKKEGTGTMEGLYNLVARPVVEGLKGGAQWLGATAGGATQVGTQALVDSKLGKSLQQANPDAYGALVDVNQKLAEGVNNIRQNNGMEGSFDQGLMSGLKTAGVGTLKGAGGALSVFDLATLGSGNIIKNVAQRGIRNTLINAPIYGAGNVAKDLRETGGQNIGKSAWEGITASKPVGITEGITGDTKYAPLVDTVLMLGASFSPYGKWTDKTAKSIVDSPEKAVKKLKEMTLYWANRPNVYDTEKGNKFVRALASRVYGSSYSIPGKISREIKPIEVFGEMIDDGVTGTPDQVRDRVEKITGKDGIFNKFVKETTNAIDDPIDTSVVKEVLRTNLKNNILLGSKKKNEIMRTVGQMLDTNQSYINETKAQEALRVAREMEKQGYALKNAGDNIFNKKPALQAEGQAYISASKEIIRQIDSMAISKGMINALKTPENLQAVEAIGGSRLVEKFMKAESWKDLRSIQAPYVKMGIILDLNEAGNFSNVLGITKNLTSKITSPVLGGILGGIPGAIAGTIVQPAVEGVAQTYLPKIQGGTATLINKLGALRRVK